MRIFAERQFSKGWITGITLGVVSSVALVVSASSVTIPNTFVQDTAAVAVDVNANFTAVKTAVDDNNSRITALEGGTPGATCAGNNASDVMVRVGPVCVDKYEASLWPDKTSGGTVPLAANTCNADGSNCTYVAQSRTGVTPTFNVTYLQATQACANAGKRLLTPGQYLMAAIGTAPAQCNTSSGAVVNTGASANCVSRDHGGGSRTNDMVGNLYEWVDSFVATEQIGPPGSVTTVGYMGSTFDTDTADAPASADRLYTNLGVTSGFNIIGFRCAR